MGLLFKIVIITFVLLFVIVKVGNFVFRNVFWILGTESVRRQKEAQPQGNGRQAYRSNGKVRVEPVRGQDANGRRAGYDEGEFVDYEEVK